MNIIGWDFSTCTIAAYGYFGEEPRPEYCATVISSGQRFDGNEPLPTKLRASVVGPGRRVLLRSEHQSLRSALDWFESIDETTLKEEAAKPTPPAAAAPPPSPAREKKKPPAKRVVMSEKDLERKLVNKLKELGVLALKYSNPSETGYPDRLCLCPGGVSFWVEVKTTGRKPTKLQQVRHDQLRQLGYAVFVVDDEPTLLEALKFARTHSF